MGVVWHCYAPGTSERELRYLGDLGFYDWRVEVLV